MMDFSNALNPLNVSGQIEAIQTGSTSPRVLTGSPSQGVIETQRGDSRVSDTVRDSYFLPSQLSPVEALLEGADTEVTFWGERVIKKQGIGGCASLDTMARRIINSARNAYESDNLTPTQRIAGVEIVKKLKNFYLLTDCQIQKANLLTQLFNWFREFSFSPYIPRFFIENTAQGDFRAYSKEKFLKQFGGDISLPDHSHPASDGISGSPFRIIAKEEKIRELLVPQQR